MVDKMTGKVVRVCREKIGRFCGKGSRSDGEELNR